MKRLLLISCFIGTLIVAERQINLEDIERDNLASEKQTANEESQKQEQPQSQQQSQDVQPPAFLPLPHHHHQQQQQQQQYIPASPPPINYYSRPHELIQQTPQFISPPLPHQQENYYRRPAQQYSPQELAEYITDNHLKLSPVSPANHQRQIPQQIPQYYQNQQPQLQHSNLQSFFLLPQLSYNPYSNNQQKTDGIQYVMYLQPATAASFLAPQTQIPNGIPHIMSLTAIPRIYTQQSKQSPMFSVQPQQFQSEQPEIRFQPQRKLVIQPEIRFMTIQAPTAHEKPILLLKPTKPQPPQPEQYIVVPQPQEPQPQPQIKSYPKSLLDSYVPSVLQLQYLKEQQLKQQQLQQQEQLKQLQEQSQQTSQQSEAGNSGAEHSSASGHLLNTIDYSPTILKSAGSAKRFAYQSYFPIQHGGGGSSFVNYRLGRYAEH